MGVRGRGHWAGSGEHAQWSFAVTEETGDGDLGREGFNRGKSAMCSGWIFKPKPTKCSANWIVEYETDKSRIMSRFYCKQLKKTKWLSGQRKKL